MHHLPATSRDLKRNAISGAPWGHYKTPPYISLPPSDFRSVAINSIVNTGMDSGYDNLLFAMQNTNMPRKVRDKCWLKIEIWRFWKLLAFLKKIFFYGHTTPTSITCDWIIHTYGRMWGDRKGRLFRQPHENCCGFTGVAKYRHKKKDPTLHKDETIISSYIQFIHFWLKYIVIDDTKFTSPTVLCKRHSATLY